MVFGGKRNHDDMLKQEDNGVNDVGYDEENSDNNESAAQTQTQSRTNDSKPLLDEFVMVYTEMVVAINKAPTGYKAPSSEKARTILLDECARDPWCHFMYAEDFSRVEKTRVEISKFLLEAIERIRPSNVLQVVTDNAANCKIAGEDVEKWQSRFLRYVDTKSNKKELKQCIFDAPYVMTRVLIPAKPATTTELAVPEHTVPKTYENNLPK
ncbi:polyprotein-like protein, partial [Tanacetum coccineum]